MIRTSQELLCGTNHYMIERMYVPFHVLLFGPLEMWGHRILETGGRPFRLHLNALATGSIHTRAAE